MKTINFAFLSALIILLSTSCVESSKKYKALLAERDSIRSTSMVVQNSYNQTLELLAAVDSGFAALSQAEKSIKLELGLEGNTAARKQEIADHFEQIKNVLAQNKAKISKLQAKLAASEGNDYNNDNSEFNETIESLQAELDKKIAEITELKLQLEQKDVQIKDLNNNVNRLTKDVENLNEETNKQKNTIAEQEAALNTVYYIIASSDMLKKANIVTGGGLFKAKTVLGTNFNKSVFNKADKRTFNSISTAVKNPKILSTHPNDSYTLDVKEDKTVVIVIKNADKFWSVSKYLVVKK